MLSSLAESLSWVLGKSLNLSSVIDYLTSLSNDVFSLRCRFAHRMTTTRNHAPIRDVAIKAGVQWAQSPTLSKHLKTPSEEADWAARRKASTKKKAVWRSSVAEVLPPPPQAHLSSSICGGGGDECPVQTNHLVGTI